MSLTPQEHNQYRGKTFQLAGPAEYSYKEVVEFVHDITGKQVPLVDVPIFMARAACTLNALSIKPKLSEDCVDQITEDAVEVPGTDMLTMKDLGIEPVSMDKMAFAYLHRFRQGGHFVKVKGYYMGETGQRGAKDSMPRE